GGEEDMIDDDRSLDALAAIARPRDGRVDPASDVAERERLVARLPVRRGGWDRSRARWMVAAAVALGLAATTAIVVWPHEDGLEYAVEGGPVTEEGYVQATGEEVTIRFNDGSRIAAHPNSAGRVIDVDASQVRLLLERGTFSVAVV